MRTAFKEWAIVADALTQGRQILILRKGGIAEGRGGFRPEHERFWLFPTLFHQQRDSVIPSAQARYDALAPALPGPDRVRIEGFAHLAAWRHIASLAEAEKLRGQHIWRDEVIANRYEWGRQQGIHALAVRVFRLPQPVELPASPSYAGCKSWVELEAGLSEDGAAPVLDDNAFAAKLNVFLQSLQS